MNLMLVWVIKLYVWITIFDIILSYMPQLKSKEWARTIHKLTDATQRPIREMFPPDIPLDPSPMIVIMLCQVLIYIVS